MRKFDTVCHFSLLSRQSERSRMFLLSPLYIKLWAAVSVRGILSFRQRNLLYDSKWNFRGKELLVWFRDVWRITMSLRRKIQTYLTSFGLGFTIHYTSIIYLTCILLSLRVKIFHFYIIFSKMYPIFHCRPNRQSCQSYLHINRDIRKYFNMTQKWHALPLKNDHIYKTSTEPCSMWVLVLSELWFCELAAVLIKKRLKIIGTLELVFMENSDKVSRKIII